MQTHAPKRVLAVVSDLFFSVKLTEAAKRCGLALEFVKDPEEVLENAKLKGNAVTKGVSLLGYLSHIQVELKQSAQDAGCDMVMARSAFSLNLTQIFKRHSGVL
jgi:hypothetical protein